MTDFSCSFNRSSILAAVQAKKIVYAKPFRWTIYKQSEVKNWHVQPRLNNNFYYFNDLSTNFNSTLPENNTLPSTLQKSTIPTSLRTKI